MPNLRDLVDGRCYESQLLAVGNSAGVRKAWESRARSKNEDAITAKMNTIRDKIRQDIFDKGGNLTTNEWMNHPLFPKLVALEWQLMSLKARTGK